MRRAQGCHAGRRQVAGRARERAVCLLPRSFRPAPPPTTEAPERAAGGGRPRQGPKHARSKAALIMRPLPLGTCHPPAEATKRAAGGGRPRQGVRLWNFQVVWRDRGVEHAAAAGDALLHGARAGAGGDGWGGSGRARGLPWCRQGAQRSRAGLRLGCAVWRPSPKPASPERPSRLQFKGRPVTDRHDVCVVSVLLRWRALTHPCPPCTAV